MAGARACDGGGVMERRRVPVAIGVAGLAVATLGLAAVPAA
jgi:hypothetical protein